MVKQSGPQFSNNQGNEGGTRRVSGVLCDETASKNEGKGEQDSGWTGDGVGLRDSGTKDRTQ